MHLRLLLLLRPSASTVRIDDFFHGTIISHVVCSFFFFVFLFVVAIAVTISIFYYFLFWKRTIMTIMIIIWFLLNHVIQRQHCGCIS